MKNRNHKEVSSWQERMASECSDEEYKRLLKALTEETEMTKKDLYKTAIWTEINEHVNLLGYYGTGAGTQWKIKTISGEVHLVDEIELTRFVL